MAGQMTDRDAGRLYRFLAPAVLGYLRAQRTPEPEDLLGDVFLQVARDLARFRGDDAALRRWVFTIAHNRVVDDARRRARRPQPTPTDDLSDHATGPPQDALDPVLLAALDRLTPDQREVVVLRFVADLPLEAVARITRHTVGSVKALQHRALDFLAREISPEAVSPEA